MADNNQESKLALVTGGTGLLGSHIAEQLHRKGYGVRAICRPGSDTSFLEAMGVNIVRGDITDPASIAQACDGVDTVYHAAARVGDWGPWSDFVRVSIDGTANMLAGAIAAHVRRFLHISSISAYGHVHGEGKAYDESAPLGVNLNRWSYYSRAKVEAEKLVWEAQREENLDVTIIRPSWLYGPRDRATLARLINSIRLRKLKLIGDGHNRLNVVHAGNVAQACVLAANSDQAIAEAYNVCHDGEITQKQYFDRIAQAIGEPPITQTIAYAVVHKVAFAMEFFGHLFRTAKAPLVTRYAVWLMGRRCFFECNKIKEQLGWSSTIGYDDGIPTAVDDYLAQTTEKQVPTAQPVPAGS